MNFLCERCGHRYEIDFRSFTPECPCCGSGAAQLQVTPNEHIDHHPDRAFPELLVSDALLFLGALWFISGCD